MTTIAAIFCFKSNNFHQIHAATQCLSHATKAFELLLFYCLLTFCAAFGCHGFRSFLFNSYSFFWFLLVTKIYHQRYFSPNAKQGTLWATADKKRQRNCFQSHCCNNNGILVENIVSIFNWIFFVWIPGQKWIARQETQNTRWLNNWSRETLICSNNAKKVSSSSYVEQNSAVFCCRLLLSVIVPWRCDNDFSP